jgi:dTDP-4-dehydrorhamnose 3,5-epimerase
MSIEGVVLSPLKIIKDDRGAVMHFLRTDTAGFQGFGEMYLSVVNPGVTKGWKKHVTAYGHLAVPVGALRFVLQDLREDSSTKGEWMDVRLSPESYQLLIIPPGVAYAWKCESDVPAFLLNCSNELWRQDESITIPFEEIVYPNW